MLCRLCLIMPHGYVHCFGSVTGIIPTHKLAYSLVHCFGSVTGIIPTHRQYYVDMQITLMMRAFTKPHCPGVGTQYVYMADLLKLEACRNPQSQQIPRELCKISTPLKVWQWAEMLSNHPDPQFTDYIVSGIENGFRVGFDYSSPLVSSKHNLPAAATHPEVISHHLEADIAQQTLLGPFLPDQFPGFQLHTNPIGVVPKKHRPGKWRLIVHLSSPSHRSVNDGIASDICSLSYVSMDTIFDRILQLGRGTLLAKVDIKSAYRVVPVHPDDRNLLGIRWEDRVLVDSALPFGLCSAPKIFNAVADALEWIIINHGAEHAWHYLDDFLVAGAPGSSECRLNLDITHHVCDRLGIPLADEKEEGPATRLTYIGYQLDTAELTISLPPEKLARISALVSEWQLKRRCTKRELSSFTGTLQHASTVVRSGRTFIRRMYDLLACAKRPSHHLNLNEGFRSDLQWWASFLTTWNGIGMISPSKPPPPSAVLTSDASGSWGCGAFWQEMWLQLSWDPISACESLRIH